MDGMSVMNQQPGTGAVSSAAKKGVVLAILIVAVGLLILFVFAKGGSKGIKIIREGDRAPEFRLSTPDGKQVSLSDHRGKVVMVHFWATWCPPCAEELPTLAKLHHDLTGNDFEMLAVSVDEGGTAAVIAFMQKNRLDIPVLLDPERSIANLYGTYKFPETYIVDRQGVVRYKLIGPRDWRDPEALTVIRKLIAAR
jgi:peroxiredoxin